MSPPCRAPRLRFASPRSRASASLRLYAVLRTSSPLCFASVAGFRFPSALRRAAHLVSALLRLGRGLPLPFGFTPCRAPRLRFASPRSRASASLRLYAVPRTSSSLCFASVAGFRPISAPDSKLTSKLAVCCLVRMHGLMLTRKKSINLSSLACIVIYM